MKHLFLATVHILVEAENNAEACDSISACLTENLRQEGAIIDWQYVQDVNKVYVDPQDKGLVDTSADMDEGELFSQMKLPILTN
jgi:hypothetical protein